MTCLREVSDDSFFSAIFVLKSTRVSFKNKTDLIGRCLNFTGNDWLLINPGKRGRALSLAGRTRQFCQHSTENDMYHPCIVSGHTAGEGHIFGRS